MVKTQIQLPDALYREAKRLAREREISLADVVRRGVEMILSVYPHAVPRMGGWTLPEPRNLGCRNLTAAELRDIARADETGRALKGLAAGR
jgi:hypothetical protein